MTIYKEGLPSAGTIKSINLLCAADTYYVGMPLTYNGTNDNHEYSATDFRAIVYEEVTLASEGNVLCLVTGSEFPEDKVVDDANATLTVTKDARQSALQNGLILR